MPRGDLLRLVWGRALVLTTAGAGIGLLLAIVVSEALRPLLFSVAPRDPVALATFAGGLVLVCSMASLLAAARAISIDPLVALRSESCGLINAVVVESPVRSGTTGSPRPP